jgi:hypothetical protein
VTRYQSVGRLSRLAPHHRLPALLAVLLAAGSATLSGQQTTLEAVLARAGDYVTKFHRDLSGIVAEEHYVQDVIGGARRSVQGVGAPPPPLDSRRVHREFKSDLLLVFEESSGRYVQFRDTYEVDGEAVQDRSKRLANLFIQPTATSLAQATRIMNESARYNLGGVRRNINVPVFPLMFLEPVNQPRFRFTGKTLKRSDVSKVSKVADFSSSAEVWEIVYREVEPKTLIRTVNQRDLPARGRFWIEASSGRVLMTELIAEDSIVHASITVTYQSPAVVGFLVPIEMREAYSQTGFSQRTEALATYSNFRRFNVTTDEKIATPTQ